MITEEERTWLNEIIAAEAHADEQRILRWCLANATTELEIDHSGELEWVVFSFGKLAGDFCWNPDDGWDGNPPILPILDALRAAERDAADGRAFAAGLERAADGLRSEAQTLVRERDDAVLIAKESGHALTNLMLDEKKRADQAEAALAVVQVERSEAARRIARMTDDEIPK